MEAGREKKAEMRKGRAEQTSRGFRGMPSQKRQDAKEEGTDLSSSNLVSPCLLGSHHKMNTDRQREGHGFERMHDGEEGRWWAEGRGWRTPVVNMKGVEGQRKKEMVEKSWDGGVNKDTTQQQRDDTTSTKHTHKKTWRTAGTDKLHQRFN